MTTPEKLEFVCSITESVKSQFADALRSGDVPEGWDGHEIRQWLADKFAHEVFRQVMKGKRLREYRNAVATSSKL